MQEEWSITVQCLCLCEFECGGLKKERKERQMKRAFKRLEEKRTIKNDSFSQTQGLTAVVHQGLHLIPWYLFTMANILYSIVVYNFY